MKLLESLKIEVDELRQASAYWDSKHRDLSKALDEKDGVSNAAEARVEGLKKEAMMMNQKIATLEKEKREMKAKETSLQVRYLGGGK